MNWIAVALSVGLILVLYELGAIRRVLKQNHDELTQIRLAAEEGRASLHVIEGAGKISK